MTSSTCSSSSEFILESWGLRLLFLDFYSKRPFFGFPIFIFGSNNFYIMKSISYVFDLLFINTIHFVIKICKYVFLVNENLFFFKQYYTSSSFYKIYIRYGLHNITLLLSNNNKMKLNSPIPTKNTNSVVPKEPSPLSEKAVL